MPPQLQPVWLPNWSDRLRELRLLPIQRQHYRTGIIRYLRYCKETRQPATVATARAFMEQVERQRLDSPSMLQHWKDALNWFFREAKRRPAAAGPASRPMFRQKPPADAMPDVPPSAATDLGATDWERKMIRVLRARHYQWRTEQTYRQWAWRFHAWLQRQNRPLEEAGETEVREFLTDLATRSRVSASTQKQALNALVF